MWALIEAVVFGQIKVLDLLNQERAAAERRDMIYLMEQRAAESREEVHTKQVRHAGDTRERH